jgi:hypothetical protein
MEYVIENTASGTIVWDGEAESAEQALDHMAHDAGYRSYEDACRAAPAGAEHLEVRLARRQGYPVPAGRPWSDECYDGSTMVVIAGRGESHTAAVRAAASDPSLLTRKLGEQLAGIGLAEREASGSWSLLDDAWCVALTPDEVSPDDLNADPAVVGFTCVDC